MPQIGYPKNTEEREINCALSALAVGSRYRASAKVAKRLLKEAPWMWNGRSYWPEARSVGCGIYEITNEKKG